MIKRYFLNLESSFLVKQFFHFVKLLEPEDKFPHPTVTMATVC